MYLLIDVDDISRNFETALAHYESALDIVKREKLLEFTGRIGAALGTALLSYPTERRDLYAQRAIVALSEAMRVVAPYALESNTTIDAMKQSELLRNPSFRAVLRYTLAVAKYARLVLPIAFKRPFWGATWREVAKVIDPRFAIRLNWQLGVAYRQLGQLDNAVAHFDLAIQQCTGANMRMRPDIEVVKGLTYIEAKSGDRPENLWLAIACFKNALAECKGNGQVRSDAFKTYARALVGDGHAYLELEAIGAITLQDRERLRGVLINQLRLAARIARAAALPRLVQEAMFFLGRGYELQRDYARTFRALALASRIADRLHRRIRTLRLSRYLTATEVSLNELLLRMSLEYRAWGYSKSAPKAKSCGPSLYAILCFAERGRTLFLQTQIAHLRLLPRGVRDEKELAKLYALRRDWHERDLSLLEEESTPHADNAVLTILSGKRNKAEACYLAELQSVQHKYGAPEYDPDSAIRPLRPRDVYSTIHRFIEAEKAAIVEYCFTGRHLVAFVLLPNGLSCLLIDLKRTDLEAIERHWREGWTRLLGANDDPAKIEVAQWSGKYLDQTLNRLRPAVAEPMSVIRRWESDTGQRVGRVIVVPHKWLNLIPIHAVPVADGAYWGDTVSIQYVPSMSLLLRLLRYRRRRDAQPQSPGADKAVVIACRQRPSPQRHEKGLPLVFNLQEAHDVAARTGAVIVTGPEATASGVIDAIEDAAYIHFACHAKFDSDRPLASGLFLAPDNNQEESSGSTSGNDRDAWTAQDRGGQKPPSLQLGDIFRRVYLPRARLVVLSACETGVTKMEESHEEYIGLPGGFLYAGATTVVSTLWSVPDDATWLLMRSLTRRTAEGLAPTEALRQAQDELRNVSATEVVSQIEQAASAETDADFRKLMLNRAKQIDSSKGSEPKPFAEPFYWAGFVVNGL